MRQGDGSDVLGPDDPRNSDIGILYVEAKDSRQTVLTALNTQEVRGRKQIAIVLPEQGKAFRHAIDFDGLKTLCRQLKAQVIFIIPSGRGPADMARQRRFMVYSSLDTFRSALLNEDAPARKQRAKSQSDAAKHPGILVFGGRKARVHTSRVPITPKLIQSAPPTPRLRNQAAPPTPRLHDRPTPLIMPRVAPTPNLQGPAPQEQMGTQDMPPVPPTPRMFDQSSAHAANNRLPQLEMENQMGRGNVLPTPYLVNEPPQPDLPTIPPTPHLAAQQGIPTPHIQEEQLLDSSMIEGIPATPDNTPRTGGETSAASNLFVDERMAAATAGILAANNLESDDDALYTPTTPQKAGTPAPTSDNTATNDTPGELPLADQPTPRELPLEDRPTPRITAFPEEAAAPETTHSDKSGEDVTRPREDARPPTATNAPAPRGSVIFPVIPSTLPLAPNQFGAPSGNPDRFAPAPGTAGSGANSGTPGQFTASGTPGRVINPGAFRRVRAGAGMPPAQPLQRGALFTNSPAANPPGPQISAAPWDASSFGGPGMGQRPSGLTPLPPPYSRRARRKRNRTLLLLTLLFLLCAFLVVGVFAQRSQLSGNAGATITLTPASKLETDNYLLSALPTGKPDPAHLQIAARLLTQNSGSSTAPAHATGSVQAKAATGTLVFFNSTSSSVTLASTTFTGKDGVQVRVDGPIVVPASGSASTSAPGYAVKPGSKGNIPAFDIGGPCCANGISVKNTASFSGGQDAQKNSVLQQSDLDNAARPLISKLTQNTGAALQKQVKSGERVIENTYQCKPTITSDHKVGDAVKTASAQVVVACTEEVYDFATAQQMATSRLQTRARNDPDLNSHYALNGQIVTRTLSNTVVSSAGQATIEMQAKGLWVYQITSQMQENIKQALPGISQADAQRILTHTTGVAAAHISISDGSSLPTNPSAITLVVQSLPQLQATPASVSNGSGSPTVIPSGTGIPPGPALTPTPTAVPGLG